MNYSNDSEDTRILGAPAPVGRHQTEDTQIIIPGACSEPARPQPRRRRFNPYALLVGALLLVAVALGIIVAMRDNGPSLPAEPDPVETPAAPEAPADEAPAHVGASRDIMKVLRDSINRARARIAAEIAAEQAE